MYTWHRDAIGMPTRVSLRRVGSLTGKLAAAPGSRSDLLELATKKLQLASPATRIFTASGDELDDDDDVLLLREDEVVYVSCGEDFSPAVAAAATLCCGAKPPLPLAYPPVTVVEKPPARLGITITEGVKPLAGFTVSIDTRKVVYPSGLPIIFTCPADASVGHNMMLTIPHTACYEEPGHERPARWPNIDAESSADGTS